MDFSLRTGDSLLVEPLSEGVRERFGDLALFMGGAKRLLLLHRVLARSPFRGGALLTKGDFHLLPDGLVPSEARIGVARVLERDGKRIRLDSTAARLAGVLLAAYSLAAVPLYRCVQLLLWILKTAFLPSPWMSRPPGEGLLVFLETAHLSLLRPALRWLPDQVWRLLARRGGSGAADEEGPAPESPGGGEIRGNTEWGGELSVFGDVVVLPGAVLTLRPGTRVRFRAPKRFHHGLRRRWEGKFHDLSGPERSRFIVYGKLRVLGDASAPVRIEGPEELWGGVLLLGRGRTHAMRHCVLRGGGVRLLGGARLLAVDVRFEDAGLESLRLAGRSRAVVERGSFFGSAAGIVSGELAAASLTGCFFSGLAAPASAMGQSLLRLEGCRLKGPGPGGPDSASTGLRVEEWGTLQVRGCSVEGFPCGVLARGTGAADVVGSRFVRNGMGAFGEQEGRLRLRWSKILRCRSHGVWVQDRASVKMWRSWVSRGGRNGAYSSGRGRLLISDSMLSGNACGVVAAGSRAVLLRVRLRASRELQLHAPGGSLRAADCLFGGGVFGVRLNGEARAAFDRCRLLGSGTSAHLAEQAAVRFLDCRLDALRCGLAAEDAADAVLRSCRLRAGSGHGIWCRGGSRVRMSGGSVNGCGDNGIFGADAARLTLEDCEIRDSRRGLACEGESHSHSAGCRFVGNGEAQAVLSAGEHRFEGCDLSEGRTGLSLAGDARVELSATRLASNSAAGLSCAGRANAALHHCVLEKNRLGAELAGACRLVCRGSSLRDNLGHGLWLREGSAALIEKTSFIANADNGLYAFDASRAELSGAEFRGNRCGAAAAGESSVEGEDCEFTDNTKVGASFEGGRHRLKGVRISGGAMGLALRGDARLCLSGSRLAEHRETGLLLSGRSSAELEESVLESNAVGAELRDQACLRALRCRFVESGAQGLLTGGGAGVELEQCELSENGEDGGFFGGGTASLLRSNAARNRRGLSCKGGAACTARECGFSGNSELGVGLRDGTHEFEDCRFEGAPAGLEAAGSAAFRMLSCLVEGHGEAGLRLSEDAVGELRELRARGNRIALLAQDRSRCSCADSGLSGSLAANVELTGGSHRFLACRLDEAPLGLSVRGETLLELLGSTVADASDAGLAAGDRSRVEAKNSEFMGNGTGVRAAGSAFLSLRGGRIAGSSGHGLTAAGAARVRLGDIAVSGNRDNGIFLEEGARLFLSDAEIEGNGCGVSCVGSSMLRVRRCSMSGNSAMGLSLGERSVALLRDLRLESSPAGAVLCADSRAVFLRAAVSRTEQGVRLTGRSKASFLASRWSGGDIGLWGQEASFVRISGGAFRSHSSQALRLSQSAGASVRGVRFSHNCMAVLLEEQGSAWIADCVFRVNPTGVKADGSSALALRRSRLRDCLLDGVWLGPGVRGDLQGNGFFGNRIGLHRHHRILPRLGGNIFLRNAYGDKRRFPEEELV